MTRKKIETPGELRHRVQAENRPEFFAIDFFCGAGGTTCGLIDAGGYVVAGVDKDLRCGTTYVKNNANRHLDSEPPRFLNLDIFPKTTRYKSGQQDKLFLELGTLISRFRAKMRNVPWLFVICAPCQPFTRLSRKELSDERKARRRRDKNLLYEATKFVDRFKPELVLSENVQGIGDPKYGGVWDDFREALAELGYVTGSRVVCASRFGVPQYRKRSILLAARKDIVREDRYADLFGHELLLPEGDPDSPLVTVRQAIGHLPSIAAGKKHPSVANHRTRGLSDLNYRRLAAAKPGESNRYMKDTPDGDLTLGCHRRMRKKLGSTSCFTDVYTRMHPDRPAPAITTKCDSISNGRFGHYDVKQVRGISLREAAILQSFPDSYVFCGDDTLDTIASMIGNAVPPKLAEFYSRYLTRSIDSRSFKRSAHRSI